MPEIHKQYTISITPEQFLNACSQLELQEVQLLIESRRYQSKMSSKEAQNEQTKWGSGKDRMGKTCRNCHGMGRIAVELPDGDFTSDTCPECSTIEKGYHFLIPDRS